MAVRMIQLSIVSLALVALLTAPAAAIDAKDLAGKDHVDGVNPDGSKYEGTVKIEFEKENTVKITWENDKKRNDVGLGRLEGNKLIISYQGAKKGDRGKAEFEVQKDGKLVG